MKIGCCGFPVAHARCYRELDAVEVNATFYKPPRLATVQRWRAEAPKGFDFTVKAWQLITHTPESPTYARLGGPIPQKRRGRYGHFRPTDEVREAWGTTAVVARALDARVVLFQTPPSFYPDPDLLRNMYTFFRSIPRHEMVLAWEPRGRWEDKLVRRVCQDLGLIHATDPLHRPPLAGTVRYLRLHGTYRQGRIQYAHSYTDAELAQLAELVGSARGYVFFNNTHMWLDARHFRGRLRGSVLES